MQTIKTFGDSFFWGNDLSDCAGDPVVADNPATGQTHLIGWSESTWPALLAKQFDMQYYCQARGGVSNSYIARSILEHADDNALNVIQWTWIDRSEYVDNNYDVWHAIRPSEQNEMSNNYYKNFHSELQDKWINLNIIVNTLKYLEDHRINYVCHMLDHTLFDRKFHAPIYITKLQQYLQPRVTWFPDETTFFEWSKLNKFDISDNWHPLEQAHEEAAAVMKHTYERHCK